MMNKLGWVISVILTCFIIYLLNSERNNSTDIKVKKILQDSTYVAYSMELKRDNPLVIGFIEDGSIRYLTNFADGFQQKLDFHDNGFLAVKTTVDSFNNIQNGRYYFFEINGNLSHNYKYLDDKKVGIAKSYHPNAPYLREYMEYDSSGNMYYRKTFDEHGNTINEEGY